MLVVDLLFRCTSLLIFDVPNYVIEAIQVLHNTFPENVTPLPPRNANKVESYTSATVFFPKNVPPPILHYMTVF